MKRIFIVIIAIGFCLLFPMNVFAMDSDTLNEEIDNLGVDEVIDCMPEYSKEMLEEVYKGFSFDRVQDIEFGNLISVLSSTFLGGAKDPISSFLFIIGVLIMCAFINNMKEPIGNASMNNIIDFVMTLSLSAVLIVPMINFIDKAGSVIESSYVFLYAYIPIFGAVTTMSGQPLSAASYSAATLTAAEISAILVSNIALPLLGILLGISIMASVSDNISLQSIAQTCEKIVKWVVGILTTVFVGILTIKSIIAGAGDTLSTKSAKFVVSNAIPIAGNTLSDSLSTVFASMKYIKGTIGAFGIIAGGFIFIPIIIENMLWLLCVNLSVYVSDVFGITSASRLFKTVSSVLSILLTLLMFTVLLIIISTAVLLMVGGGAGG